MEQVANSIEQEVLEGLGKVKVASRKLVGLSDSQINEILNRVADLAIAKTETILVENQKDLDNMDKDNPKYDRLLLSKERLEGIASDIRNVGKLTSPLGTVLEERTMDNGLLIKRVSVALGTIGIVYESRPNVTFDVFALCLKSGNACVLKGSRDAHFSNLVIVELIKEVLAAYGLEDTVFLAPSDREALKYILEAEDYIDTVIPRGSQGLINYVRQNARVPVIETGAGIVHTYVDAKADVSKAAAIVSNAKTRRVSVCNALDCLIIHEDQLSSLYEIIKDMESNDVEVFADEKAYPYIEGKYPDELLFKASKDDFGVEFLSYKMSIKTVSTLQEAIDHISKYSSQHSETIVSEDEEACDFFLKHVDAACVYANASTAFSDGAQFGLGAEIGISTQKLHARGPMGLRELTSYKWVIKGSGQVRA